MRSCDCGKERTISGESNKGGAQTVDRALQVLKVITAQRKPILLDDISERVQLHKSITYRLVRSLEMAEFVARDPVIGGYSVGSALLSLSVAIASRIDIRRIVRPALEEIVKQFGETASLHVRSGNVRVCVDTAEGTHPVRRVIPIGETLPLYAGETGRILLSGLSSGELEQQLEAAHSSGMNIASLKKEVASAREQGWIIGIGMRTPEVGSLSIGLRGSSGLAAALTISGPVNRWNEKAMSAALPAALRIVAALKAELSTVSA